MRSLIGKGKPLVWMMRTGYLARGIVFLIIGAYALLAAGGLGANPHGVRRALELLLQRPFGNYFLWALAAGLLCFAGWRLRQSIFGASHNNGFVGWMHRGVLTGSGLFYIALAAAIAGITVEQRQMIEGESTRESIEWLMARPFGRGLLVLIAAGFVVVAIGLAVKAFRSPSYLNLDATKLTRASAVVLASFGCLMRAIVLFIIGAYLAIASYDSNSHEAVGMAGVVRAMRGTTYGGLFLGIVALGLLAFGFFEIVEAVTRRSVEVSADHGRGHLEQ